MNHAVTHVVLSRRDFEALQSVPLPKDAEGRYIEVLDEGTDPINEGGTPEPTPAPSRFGFFGRLVGNDHIDLSIKLARDAETSHWRTLMARLDPIDAALGNISTQLSQLSGQIADLTAGSVTDAEIAALAAKAQGIADAVDAAIEPDAGEGEPPVEPPVEPVP